MGRLDVHVLRYLNSKDFRVLTSIEMGMRDHEYVPLELCLGISDLKKGGGDKILQSLVDNSLIAYEPLGKYGKSYRLTNSGYDFLALNVLLRKKAIKSFGNQIGVGKESDIYVVADTDGNELCLKLHRLGRTSFRQVKTKRDYHKNRTYLSWLHLSRLSASKEFAYLKILHEHGFPVPEPIECDRHAVLMELIRGVSLSKVKRLENPARIYHECMDIITRLAECGLIHGDFNEFNMLLGDDNWNEDSDDDEGDGDDNEVREKSGNGESRDDENDDEEEEDADGKLWVIDLPQMVSTSHENAEWYFDRDVECVVSFFKKRFAYECDYRPNLNDIVKKKELDIEISASGCIKKRRTRIEAGDKNENDIDDEEEEEKEEDLLDMLASTSLESQSSQKNNNEKYNKESKEEEELSNDEDEDEGDDDSISDDDNEEEEEEDGSNDEVGDKKNAKVKNAVKQSSKNDKNKKVVKTEDQWRRTIKSELDQAQLKMMRKNCRKREEERARSKRRGKKENFNVSLKQSINSFF